MAKGKRGHKHNKYAQKGKHRRKYNKHAQTDIPKTKPQNGGGNHAKKSGTSQVNGKSERRDRAQKQDTPRAKGKSERRDRAQKQDTPQVKPKQQIVETPSGSSSSERSKANEQLPKADRVKLSAEYSKIYGEAKSLGVELKAKEVEYLKIADERDKLKKELSSLRNKLENLTQKVETIGISSYGLARKKKMTKEIERLELLLSEKMKEFGAKEKECNDLMKEIGEASEEFNKIVEKRKKYVEEFSEGRLKTDLRIIREYDEEIKKLETEEKEIKEKIEAVNAKIEADRLQNPWNRFKSYFKKTGRSERAKHRELEAEKLSLEQNKKDILATKERAKSKLKFHTDVKESKLWHASENPYAYEAVLDKAKEASKKEQEQFEKVDLPKAKGKLSKTKIGKELLAKYAKDAEQIAKVMEGIIKLNPKGFPYPGDKGRFQIKHNKKIAFNDEDEAKEWADAYKTVTLDYKTVMDSLNMIFGKDGYLDRLARSPYTNQTPGRFGFVNLAQGAMKAWNDLRLREKMLLFSKISAIFKGNRKSTARNSDLNEISKKALDDMKKTTAELLDDTDKIFKDCIKILQNGKKSFGREKGEDAQKAIKAIDENKTAIKKFEKEIETDLNKFQEELKKSDTVVGSFFKNHGTFMDILGKIFSSIPVVGKAASSLFNSGRSFLGKAASAFSLKENNSELMKSIQTRLYDNYNKLNEEYKNVIEEYDNISKQFTKYTLGSEERSATDFGKNKTPEEKYIELLNDWRDLEDSIDNFREVCIKLGAAYNQRLFTIHLNKGIKYTQKAKWLLKLLFEKGIFDIESRQKNNQLNNLLGS